MATTAKFDNVLLSAITADSDFNIRKEAGDIKSLTESIKSLGLQTPVGVQETSKGVYTLIYGFRRVAAATELGLKKVPAAVYGGSTKKAELLLLNLTENVARESLNPMEEAEGIARLRDEGMALKAIGEALTFSKTLITQRLQLLNYTEPVSEALREEKISVAQARAINSLPEDRHERFTDVAAELPIAKLRELVERELERIEIANNPQPLDAEDVEDDAEEIEDVDTVDPTTLVNSIVANLCDMAAHHYTGKKGGEEQTARAIVVVKSIEWGSLGFDDLEAFNTMLDAVSEIGGFEGASDLGSDSE